MNVSIFEDHHFQKSLWSGGSTTQLYIFPEDSSFTERTFEVRISTAHVEVKKSNFTSLPGVNRKLMILEGEITISHKNRYSKHLKPFDVDAFKGEWKTTAIGTCTDFNVMTTGNIQSKLSSLEVTANNNTHIKLEDQWEKMFLYVLKGSLQIEIDQKIYLLKKNNLLVVSRIDTFIFPLHAIENSQLVIVKIN